MKKYIHEVEPWNFGGIDGVKYYLARPLLKYLYTEVFNNVPCTKEVYEELFVKVNSENEAIYYTTINRTIAYQILWAATDLIADYIAGLLKRWFGPGALNNHKLFCCQVPASIYASHLHSLGVECLKLNFDYTEDGILTKEDFESICYDDLWQRSTIEQDVDAVVAI